MKKRLMILSLLCCLLMTGCTQSKIIEDILLVQAIGFDSISKNMMRGTLGYSKFSGPQSRNPVPEVISAKGKTTKEIESKINSQVALPVEMGQLRVVVFGKKLAKQGVQPIVDTLIRDPEIGTTIDLAVADGKAERILARRYLGNYTVPAMYIANMFEQNIRRQNLPTTNLHVFGYHLHDPDCDSILPIIGEHKDHVVIKGLALFHNGKYIAEVPGKHMFIFKRLYENADSGLYQVEFHYKGKKSLVDVRNITSHVSHNVKNVSDVFAVTFNVKMQGTIVESTGTLNLKSVKTIESIQKQMEKQFKEKAQKMIKRFQKLGVDPLCIGTHVRSHDRSWNKQWWDKMYPRVHIHVNVDVDIQQTGALD